MEGKRILIPMTAIVRCWQCYWPLRLGNARWRWTVPVDATPSKQVGICGFCSNQCRQKQWEERNRPLWAMAVTDIGGQKDA